jgi:hypothetical protein
VAIGLPERKPLEHAHVIAKLVHRKPPLRAFDNAVASLTLEVWPLDFAP